MGDVTPDDNMSSTWEGFERWFLSLMNILDRPCDHKTKLWAFDELLQFLSSGNRLNSESAQALYPLIQMHYEESLKQFIQNEGMDAMLSTVVSDDCIRPLSTLQRFAESFSDVQSDTATLHLLQNESSKLKLHELALAFSEHEIDIDLTALHRASANQHTNQHTGVQPSDPTMQAATSLSTCTAASQSQEMFSTTIPQCLPSAAASVNCSTGTRTSSLDAFARPAASKLSFATESFTSNERPNALRGSYDTEQFDEDTQSDSNSSTHFMSARAKFTQDRRDRNTNVRNKFEEQYQQQKQRFQRQNSATSVSGSSAPLRIRRSLGTKRKFTPPSRLDDTSRDGSSSPSASGTYQTPSTVSSVSRKALRSTSSSNPGANNTNNDGEYSFLQEGEEMPEALQNLEPRMIELIMSEIMHTGEAVTFNDIAGLEHAKRSVVEMVVWPMKRPDLFTGLRSISKGLLLFGPPGTGKTLIGKAIAHQCGATFFSISASSLTSKWVGEGEKMVRTLFAVAVWKQPSVIFIDEVDSLLTARSDNENESSRRIKTEFLVQLDGAGTKSTDQVLVVGATNRPQELDEAARRRFVKRLYIPLPDEDGRRALISTLLTKNAHTLSTNQLESVVTKTHGYSGADIAQLCREAAMGPVRKGLSSISDINQVTADMMPPIGMQDFEDAFRQVRKSVAASELTAYHKWNAEFGSVSTAGDEQIQES